jgi:hypothetical protein
VGTVFEHASVEADRALKIVDASIVHAHQVAAGRKRVQTTLGSLSERFLDEDSCRFDPRRRPLLVTLTSGQRHETTVVELSIEHSQGQAFVADTAYRENWSTSPS